MSTGLLLFVVELVHKTLTLHLVRKFLLIFTHTNTHKAAPVTEFMPSFIFHITSYHAWTWPWRACSAATGAEPKTVYKIFIVSSSHFRCVIQFMPLFTFCSVRLGSGLSFLNRFELGLGLLKPVKPKPVPSRLRLNQLG